MSFTFIYEFKGKGDTASKDKEEEDGTDTEEEGQRDINRSEVEYNRIQTGKMEDLNEEQKEMLKAMIEREAVDMVLSDGESDDVRFKRTMSAIKNIDKNIDKSYIRQNYMRSLVFKFVTE